MTLVAALLGAWQFATARQLPTPARLFVFAVIASVLGVGVAISYGYMLFLQPWREEFWRSLYSLGLVIAALGVMTYLLTPLMSQRRQIARLLPWLAGALVPLALIGWDARTPWTEFVECPNRSEVSCRTHSAECICLLGRRAGNAVVADGAAELFLLRPGHRGPLFP